MIWVAVAILLGGIVAGIALNSATIALVGLVVGGAIAIGVYSLRGVQIGSASPIISRFEVSPTVLTGTAGCNLRIHWEVSNWNTISASGGRVTCTYRKLRPERGNRRFFSDLWNHPPRSYVADAELFPDGSGEYEFELFVSSGQTGEIMAQRRARVHLMNRQISTSMTAGHRVFTQGMNAGERNRIEFTDILSEVTGITVAAQQKGHERRYEFCDDAQLSAIRYPRMASTYLDENGARQNGPQADPVQVTVVQVDNQGNAIFQESLNLDMDAPAQSLSQPLSLSNEVRVISSLPSLRDPSSDLPEPWPENTLIAWDLDYRIQFS